MLPTGPPTAKEILKISRRTANIIRSNITSDVCLFGSAAAHLWADTGRVPNDIDILVNSVYYNAESIKQTIVDADGRYFLERSKVPFAKYKILYCCLPGFEAYNRCVKVDILVPPSGNLGLPRISAYDIPLICDIPVMPLFDLLVLKTQGWWDHRTSPRDDMRAKEGGDIDDVDALLDRADDEDIDYDEERAGHTDEFMDRALLLARRFVTENRGRRGQWLAIGFPL